jgi:beta-glucosidase
MESWRERVAGILMLWYPGMRGGNALASVLFGAVNPSGRLPFSVAKRVEDLPYFDRAANDITYDLWHGYTKLEREGVAPAYPFGFGLSYSQFAFSNPSARYDAEADRLRLAIDVANEGGRDGTAVVQAYAGWAEADVDQPKKRLCAFGRIDLSVGEQKRVDLEVPLRQLAFFDVDAQSWKLGASAWRIQLGASSADGDGLEVAIEIPLHSYSIRQR